MAELVPGRVDPLPSLEWALMGLMPSVAVYLQRLKPVASDFVRLFRDCIVNTYLDTRGFPGRALM